MRAFDATFLHVALLGVIRMVSTSDLSCEKLEELEENEETDNSPIDREEGSNGRVQRTSITNDEKDFEELPVIAYKAEIMECIRRNRIVICISETGR